MLRLPQFLILVAATLAAVALVLGTQLTFGAILLVMWVGLAVWAVGWSGFCLSLIGLGWLVPETPLSTLVLGMMSLSSTVAVSLFISERRRRRHRALVRKMMAQEQGLDHLREHLSRYPKLLDASLALATAISEDQVADILARTAGQLMPGCRGAQVYLQRNNQLIFISEEGTNPPPEAGVLAYVVQEGRQLVRRAEGSAQILLPLRADRRAVIPGVTAVNGVLNVEPHAPRGVLLVSMDVGHRDELDLEVLAAAARLGGLGLAAVDLVMQARALALTDDLTGLLGAHEFMRRLEEHLSSARRRQQPVTVLACDLDHLKKYNDSFGHPAGDLALLAVAKVIISQVPHGALASRSGGEEFSVLLPETDQSEALRIAQTICEAVRMCQPDPDHPERRITMCIGVATLLPHETATMWQQRADAACYQGKAQGRDQVVLA